MADRVSMSVTVDGLDDVLRLLRGAPKLLSAAARDASVRITTDEADRIRARADRTSRAAAWVGRSVKAKRDRVPAITAGGAGRLPVGSGRRDRPKAGDVFFGIEFGGQARPSTQQFAPHLGREGYFFWPQLRDDTDRIFDEWATAIDKLAREWDRDG